MKLENVKTIVIGADGERLGETLNAREMAMLETVDAALRSITEFQIEFPDAILEQVESMRGIQDFEDGRFYLRYKTAHNPLPIEFWGCLAKTPSVDWASGYIRVSQENIAAQIARAAPEVALPSTSETPIKPPMTQDPTPVSKTHPKPE